MTDLYQSALLDARSGDFPSAEAKLARLLKGKLPRDAEAAVCALMGAVNLHGGKVDAAVKRLQRSVRLRDDSADAHSNLCSALLLQGRNLKAAVRHGRRAVALRPDFVEAHLNLGNALEEEDDLDAAVSAYERVLTLRPGLPEGHYNLGNALGRRGDHAAAVSAYEAALAARPDFVAARFNLGGALEALGDLDAAISAYRSVLALAPDHAEALVNLGTALKEKGAFAEAAAQFERALTAYPRFAAAHLGRGNVREAQGDMAGAIEAYRRAIELAPDIIEAHVNLGRTLGKTGDFAAAVAVFEELYAGHPGLAEAPINLGNALKAQGDLDGAIGVFDQAIAAEPRFVEAHLHRGFALEDRGALGDAIAAYRQAVDIRPDFAPALVALGYGLQQLGDRDGAIDAFNRAIETRPDLGEAHHYLSLCLRYREGDAHLLRLRALAAQDLAEDDRMHLAFALAKAEEDCGNYDTAFSYYVEANAAKRRALDYDPALEASLRQDLLRFDDALQGQPIDPRADRGDPCAIFIVGVPRCGSTLVENILSLNPDVVDLGETRAFGDAMARAAVLRAEPGPAALASLREQYFATALPGRETPRIATDKMLGNALYCGLIARAMPSAKIVHMIRNPLDNIVSIYRNHFGHGNGYAYDLEEITDYYHAHRRFMAIWRERYADRVFTCDYDRLVSEPDRIIPELVEFCGFEWDPVYLEPHRNRRVVKTASLDQVRRPIYATSVKSWKRYEKQLQPIAERLRGLGYDID